MPVGSTETVAVDVRILAATNADLMSLVKTGEFREVLFYRLNVVQVEVPPLRRRQEDIQILAEHFLHKYAVENDRDIDALAPETIAALNAHRWPGNVRELENAIIQAVVLSRGPLLLPEDLPPEVRGLAAGESAAGEEEGPENLLPPGLSLGEAVASYERRLIKEALARSAGVQRQAARLLGIRPTTLNEKLKRLGLRITAKSG